jgi:4'-phosphopantetheinyl transferase
MHFVDIWTGHLTVNAMVLQMLDKLLDAQEQERARQFKQPLLRDRFIASRGLLRLTLAHYLTANAVDLRFCNGEFGKPLLVDHHLYFNLSHTADIIALAVSDLPDIGIDIELIQPRDRLTAVAYRCFSPQEFQAWQRTPSHLQPALFYRLWTKKEAFVKAVGRGIALGLHECEIECPEGLRFAKIPSAFGLAGDWGIQELALEHPLVGAVVAPKSVFKIQYFDINTLEIN